MLMREKSAELIKGINLVRELIGAKETIIGIEDNKPEALAQLNLYVKKEPLISIKVVPTIYPSGDAKRLIFLIKGTKIPKQKRAAEYGLSLIHI